MKATGIVLFRNMSFLVQWMQEISGIGIEKPLPLLKKRSLVNRIVDFIRQHTEKYQ